MQGKLCTVVKGSLLTSLCQGQPSWPVTKDSLLAKACLICVDFLHTMILILTFESVLYCMCRWNNMTQG